MTPPGLVEPEKSPAPTKAQLATVMIADDEELDNETDEATMEKLRRERERTSPSIDLGNGRGSSVCGGEAPRKYFICLQIESVTQGKMLIKSARFFEKLTVIQTRIFVLYSAGSARYYLVK